MLYFILMPTARSSLGQRRTKVLILGEKVDLREIPSAVVGNRTSRHSIILAKSGPAKKYGIHTGEPLFQALEKCPNLTVV